MTPYRQIRADYDRDSIVVYQAYSDDIAVPTVEAGKFVAPFSWRRMTWIKPSFLWLMARCNWGGKKGQKRILAIRIKREGWERALSLGTLTSFESLIHQHETNWRNQFEIAKVHVQWDPERTIHGKKLEHRSIQVGLSRHIIREFTDDWVLEISDISERAHKIRSLYLTGNLRRAKELLPRERIYSVSGGPAKQLGIAG